MQTSSWFQWTSVWRQVHVQSDEVGQGGRINISRIQRKGKRSDLEFETKDDHLQILMFVEGRKKDRYKLFLTLSILHCLQGGISWSTPCRKIDAERMSALHQNSISDIMKSTPDAWDPRGSREINWGKRKTFDSMISESFSGRQPEINRGFHLCVSGSCRTRCKVTIHQSNKSNQIKSK